MFTILAEITMIYTPFQRLTLLGCLLIEAALSKMEAELVMFVSQPPPLLPY